MSLSIISISPLLDLRLTVVVVEEEGGGDDAAARGPGGGAGGGGGRLCISVMVDAIQLLPKVIPHLRISGVKKK